MKVWTINYQGTGYTVNEQELGILTDELKNGDIGDTFTISVEEMSEEVFNNLPEFQGF